MNAALTVALVCAVASYVFLVWAALIDIFGGREQS